MSIDTCKCCGSLIDTDYFPEVYREDFDYTCLCDSCYDKVLCDSENMKENENVTL